VVWDWAKLGAAPPEQARNTVKFRIAGHNDLKIQYFRFGSVTPVTLVTDAATESTYVHQEVNYAHDDF
jgi:hypothetical protein